MLHNTEEESKSQGGEATKTQEKWAYAQKTNAKSAKEPLPNLFLCHCLLRLDVLFLAAKRSMCMCVCESVRAHVCVCVCVWRWGSLISEVGNTWARCHICGVT